MKKVEGHQRNDDLNIMLFFYRRLTQQLRSHTSDGEFQTRKIIRQRLVSLLKRKGDWKCKLCTSNRMVWRAITD